jgi:diguanylate cyclase (GGDEF)-like protein
MNPGKGFSNWTDKLVSVSYASDQEILYKARILASIVWMYIGILLITSFYLFFFAPIPFSSAVFSALLLLVMAVGYAYVLREIKSGKDYESCIDRVVFFTFIGVVAGIATSGGPLEAPCTPFLVVPIILAFALGTRNSGVKWSVITLLTHIAMIGVNEGVVKFPQFLDADNMLTYHVLHWVVVYLAIIFLLLIFSSITYRLKRERDAERDRYAYLAAHDPLTGLANRSMFDIQLTRALANCDRNNNIVGLMMIDLDGFKPVNDQYGHDVGDQVLRIIAERLQILLRKTDTIARMGGDEFAVILENVMTPPGVGIVADRVIAEINRPYEGLPAGVKIGASIGVAMYPDHTSNEEKLRVFADRAMYVAKKEHNCYRVFAPEMEFIAD